ncbi:MAG: sulfite exporter TauE/SafE family protein [Verrucomicrobiota bacterium]|jgi:uncharacterized protein
MTAAEALILASAAGAAGVINAVAGGGTLLTFPALIFVGTSPIVANATSTLALVVGTVGSVFGYRRQIAEVKPWLKRFMPVSLLGGLLGGILLTITEEELFARMVPFLILFATLVFLGQGAFRRFAGFKDKSETTTQPHQRILWAAILFQFLVAVYGGYFGAGIGILMLASLGFLGLTNIHQMNGLKTVLGSLINLVAAVYFIFAGLIDWPKMLVMMAAAVVGYYIGAHFSQRIPQKRVRQLITAIGFLISAAMFYDQFG